MESQHNSARQQQPATPTAHDNISPAAKGTAMIFHPDLTFSQFEIRRAELIAEADRERVLSVALRQRRPRAPVDGASAARAGRPAARPAVT
jgi:hypothetical protein